MIQGQLVGFTTYTRLLVTAECRVSRVCVVTVHPYTARLNITAHAVSAIGIASPYTGAQPEFGIIGNRKRFFLGFERSHANNRPEDLLLEYPHLVVALEQRGLDVEPVIKLTTQALTITTSKHNGTFIFTNLQVRHDLVELLLACLCTYLYVGIQRISSFDRLGTFNNLLHELFVHIFLYQCPRWTGANLTLVEECQHQTFHTLVYKLRLSLHHIGEIDVRRLTAQLDR